MAPPNTSMIKAPTKQWTKPQNCKALPSIKSKVFMLKNFHSRKFPLNENQPDPLDGSNVKCLLKRNVRGYVHKQAKNYTGDEIMRFLRK